MAYVRCDNCEDSSYVKPTQLGILTKRYPLVRGLYCIVKEQTPGLGAGFVSFLKNERGQLIFRRAYLGHKMSFNIRDVKINEKYRKFNAIFEARIVKINNIVKFKTAK